MSAFKILHVTKVKGLFSLKQAHPRVITIVENTTPIVLVSLQGGALVLESHKEIDIFLIRGAKVGKILTSKGRKKGQPEVGDVIIIAQKDTNTTHDDLLDFISSQFNGEDTLIDPIAVVKIVEDVVTTVQKDVVKEKVDVQAVTSKKFNRPRFNLSLPSKTELRPKLMELLGTLKNKMILTDSLTPEDPRKVKNKKILLIASVILTLLLCVSLFVTIRETRNKKREKILNEALTLITPEYEEAVNDIDLNPVRSRELLASAKMSLSPLLKDFPKDSVEYKKANEWLAKVDSAQMQAYKIYSLTDVPLFFDISFIKAGGQVDKLSVFEDTAALLDIKNQAVYTLTLASKQAKVLAGFDTIKDGKGIALYGENTYVLNSEGIVKIPLSTGKGTQIITKDEKWVDVTDIAMYGANLYALDKGKPQIWKYIAAESGFNPIQPYLNDANVNFDTASALVIDGSIWSVTDKGIYKFTRGTSEDFKIRGFADTIPIFNALSAVEDNQKLYILDKTLSRIVVFDKEGIYQSQYQWSELKNATTIYASEQSKKIYVAIGSKIYAIDLK